MSGQLHLKNCRGEAFLSMNKKDINHEPWFTALPGMMHRQSDGDTGLE